MLLVPSGSEISDCANGYASTHTPAVPAASAKLARHHAKAPGRDAPQKKPQRLPAEIQNK